MSQTTVEGTPDAGGTRARVSCRITDGVADVRLDRPDKLNALDRAMFRGLIEVGESLRDDPSIRAVVLSGEGRGFCAGLDLEMFSSMASEDRGRSTTRSLGERLPGRITNEGQQAARIWSDLPVPTIAAVHGVALGGGFQVALGADLRIVAPDVRLSVLEIRWGLVPDMTGTHVLPRLVGLQRAQELTWTGRMVGGEEAVRIGLAVETAEDPRARALELATQIAASNPDAIRDAKYLLARSLDATAADQFLEESRLMASLIGSPNQVEAVRAWFDKRPARFSDPA
jgi:enoyl-CoA hydratase/carnithine racemase